MSSSSAATSALPTVTIGGWTGREPAIVYFSGDAGNVATGLTWSAWDQSHAVGRGTRNELSCVPNCAEGSSTPYPVMVTLTAPLNGEFTMVTEQTQDENNTTETFTAPHIGTGACTTNDESTCTFG